MLSTRPYGYRSVAKGTEELLNLISQNRIRDAKSENNLVYLHSDNKPERKYPMNVPKVCSVLECYVKEDECDDCSMMDGYAHLLSNAKYTMSLEPVPKRGLMSKAAVTSMQIDQDEDEMDLD